MKQIIRQIDAILTSKERRQLAGIIVLLVIQAVFETVGVSLIVPIVSILIDETFIYTNELAIWACRILHIQSNTEFIVLLLLSFAGLYLLKGCFTVFVAYVNNKFVCDNQVRVQQKLMKIYLSKPYEYYLNHTTSELIVLVNSSVPTTYTTIGELMNLVAQGFVSIALGIAVFAVQPVMAIILSFVLLCELLLIFKFFRKKAFEIGNRQYEESAIISKWLIQTVEGIKDTKVSRKESYYCNKYTTHADISAKLNRTKNTIKSIPTALIEAVTIGSVMLILVGMVSYGYNIAALMPALSAFAIAAIKLLPAANKISGHLNSIPSSTIAVNRLYTFYVSEAERKKEIDPFRCIDLTSLDKNFDTCGLENVSYHYPNSDEWILKDASLEIKAGQSIGIVGSSGAGKTTAIDIFLGLLAPQSGKVVCDGVDIMEDYDRWLSKISYIPQIIYMLDDSIATNVAYGLEEKDWDEKEIWRALEEAQLAEFVRSLPQGIHTQIGERGMRLSGGQRQRIGIARALYSNPQILILDEATSALDNETESAIMESINALHGRKTMIIIAHRLSTIERCDAVYRIANGKIITERTCNSK